MMLHRLWLLAALLVAMGCSEQVQTGPADNVVDMRSEVVKAISAGDENALIQLLEAEPQLLNAPDPMGAGRTPLHTAAATGNEAIIRLLLEKGADINARDDDGASAAELALTAGVSPDVMNLLRGASGG